MPNFPFESTTQFVTTHIIPRIKPSRYTAFVRNAEDLRFGIGPLSTNGKAPPTSELALQDGEVVDIQGLVLYLVNDGKENFIVHLVLRLEDKELSKSYKPSSSTPTPQMKKEPQVKKESKRPPFKKVKQEPKIKEEPKVKVYYITFL